MTPNDPQTAPQTRPWRRAVSFECGECGRTETTRVFKSQRKRAQSIALSMALRHKAETGHMQAMCGWTHI